MIWKYLHNDKDLDGLLYFNSAKAADIFSVGKVIYVQSFPCLAAKKSSRIVLQDNIWYSITF